jgi:molybdenum cofactor cytidylyltransferase
MASVSIIVLAAGRATRFGGASDHKLLATLDDAPVVRHAVRAAVDAGVGPVIVVTGAEATRIAQAVSGLDVRVVHEPAFADGMSVSLRRGLRDAAPHSDAVIVALGDQPRVRPDAYRELVAAWAATGAAIVTPRYADAAGPSHPVLFAASVFHELLAIGGDTGARDVIARDRARVRSATLNWPAPIDVDTADDLDKLTSDRSNR